MVDNTFQLFFVIFSGAAVLSALALYTKQPLLLAYICLGVLLGPFGIGVVEDVAPISEIARVGIVFLLFLLGLDMQPKALLTVLQKATLVGCASSIIFAVSGYMVAIICDYPPTEAIIVGMAMMFSSTIIGIKLLPTTVLHHKHAGELMVGLLLFQDFLAILCLIILFSGSLDTLNMSRLAQTFIALPLFIGAAWLAVRFCIIQLIAKFDRFHEFIFLLAIGWCLGLAELAEAIHLSAEIGAFIAGILLATSPISKFIAIHLKPLRDFFLVVFFFALGAQFNLELLPSVLISAIALAALMLGLKPLIFGLLLRRYSERASLSWDIGIRLGQISEFSLLIGFVALSNNMISEQASTLIQATAILTFMVSSYIVILYLPNPIAVKDHLRRD